MKITTLPEEQFTAETLSIIPIMMKDGEVAEAQFIERPNRFLGRVKFEGRAVEVFIPNPGRMHELMVPEKQVFIRRNTGNHRKTDFDLIAVWHKDLIVSIDSNLPNHFMKDMLQRKELDWFLPYDRVISEPQIYDGRFDFKLDGSFGATLIEVKSCTLVEDRHALFPDAPTTRGTRHLKHLARALIEGKAKRSAVVFVIQRPDARVFSPNAATDPLFAQTLEEAHEAGVEVYPLVTEVRNWTLSFLGIIPFRFQ